ncbi:hypothetical protein DICPUDRAFT_79735 [Dictyostelium purpureum]|uniref:MRH domain-containing protein n=1 Tax=Dictyostelium purpureum TaxID=5786 RepID=F0ZNG5_DICPU|nr:uncharacterized protein DICPUDRAFT_79735 [Dictyostelium purpureum]EGC34511.1 hypothetical protein DICPUDRAFT_79735 [Dictyostelium purpureum]|eukprot:XP_003288947.1 hypothetical protein DICPUDRAFT_79735 [Dictyostelium purpureum]
MNKFLLTFITFIFLSLVNSQQSPNSCTYNGIDYSNLFLSNSSYTSNSTDGKYTYYWNICGESKKCLNTGFSVCSYDNSVIILNGIHPLYLSGSVDQGSFRTVNGNTVLIYSTNAFPCSNYIYRQTEITLICSNSSFLYISDVYETKCRYTVTMTGLAACGINAPNVTNSPTPSPQIVCKLNDYGLFVNSTSPISCTGIGQTKCHTVTDSLSVSSSDYFTFETSSGSIQCLGDNIECTTANVKCSIDPSSYYGLKVNGKETKLNHYYSSSN